MLFGLVDRIAAPLIVTLHTVLAEPTTDQRRVMARLIARASKLVVMSERSRHLLHTVYQADADQVALIPHGVPDRPFGRSAQFKTQFGFEGKAVVLTFGLLSSGKPVRWKLSAVIVEISVDTEPMPFSSLLIACASTPSQSARVRCDQPANRRASRNSSIII